MGPRPPSICNFCGQAGHFMRECPVCAGMIAAGKCRRDQMGRIVLPSGAQVSRELAGNNFAERIEEYHRLNPNQHARGQLMFSIQNPIPTPPSTAANMFKLSTSERRAHLERELDQLNAMEIYEMQTRAGRQRNRDPAPEAPPARIQHPYAAAKDGVQAPAKGKQPVVPPPKESAIRRAEAMKNLPPIYDKEIARKVYQRYLEATVPITLAEMLSLAPEVRSQNRDDVTTKRAPANKTGEVAAMLQAEVEDVLPFLQESDDEAEEQRVGATVIPCPVEMAMRDINASEESRTVHVAKESSALRAIYPVIDNNMRVECVVDAGSQIIAMSEAVCHQLSLSYDPTIILNMQSANGEVDQSLGLA
ncbi:hypothetical protein BJ138DRAFT_1019702 [Hygrophoropsis aurantiaca]|uniref:Uncharacterized protein n=1 Tax=Hygrophoropsis aurantiaca TaxID=72124 RepID=A0ACB7ZT33_9AGAM|nr:hypothetical protein BJ138DRAFT_1019702 [Hygrophoropsis aurantiaca]